MMTEQDKAKKKLQKIRDNFKDARYAVREGDLERAVNDLFDGLEIAKILADDVYNYEQLTKFNLCGNLLNHFILCGHLSQPAVARTVSPLFDIADKIKDKDQDKKYDAITDFLIGVAYFTQRRYELAITYLKKAKCRFDNNRQIHNALMILGEVYERQGINKKGCRETYIEAMLLMPQSNAPFELYASGVMRREYDCIGLNYDKRKKVVGGMRAILKESNTRLISVIDKKLVEYITGFGKEFREYYPHLPVAAFSAKTG